MLMVSSRRQFLATSAAACGFSLSAATAASPADPPVRMQGSHLKLSLAGYSFNRLFARRGTPEQIASAEMNLERFIDFCAGQGLGATELTGYYFPKDVTPEYLLSLRARTHRLGLAISGTAIGNDFCLPQGEQRQRQLQDCRDWIDYASIMGAPVIRIFAGKVPAGDSEGDAIARCVEGINQSLKYAAEKGVMLALENHGGVTATPDQMLSIVEQVDDSPWFGVNFDSGNFRTADPYGDLARIAPYAVNAQVKVSIAPNGQRQPADFNRILTILRDADYRGYVALEYEEKESPFEAIPPLLEQLKPLMG
jgi:sugar phosphate isomerase/epimerase